MSGGSIPAVLVHGLGAEAGSSAILRDIDFHVDRGEIVVLSGPSGSGKSTVVTTVAGLERPGLRLSGEVSIDGEPPERSARVGYLPQHAPTTLNPARRIGHALDELVRLHADPVQPRSRRHRAARVTPILRMVGFDLDEDELTGLLRRFPFEFSGGQRTRLALAQVLAARPSVLVLDEPTVGLDPLSSERLFAQLEGLRNAGLAILLATHDRTAVSRLADRTVSIRGGQVIDVRQGPPTFDPSAAPPAGRRVVSASTPTIAMRDVEVRLGRKPIVSDITLELSRGEAVGMLGPSGAGKSTIARCLAGLVPVKHGEVLVQGRRLPLLRRRTRHQLATLQYIWQESASSFEPRRRVLDQVATTAIRLRGLSIGAAEHEALAVLRDLDIDATQARRYPVALSGGQLQRAAVARALLAEPSVLLCDEVTTGLDEPLAVSILETLWNYQQRTDAAILLIGHDARALASRCDRIAVVQDGQFVRSDTPANLMAAPGTDAIRALLGITGISELTHGSSRSGLA